MTKEQEKAIEELYHLAHINTYLDLQVESVVKISREIIEKWKNATNLVLNLVQTQQAEIEKKDKIIDLMSYVITHEDIPQEEYCIWRDMSCEIVGGNKECKNCIKQYFERKIEQTEQH